MSRELRVDIASLLASMAAVDHCPVVRRSDRLRRSARPAAARHPEFMSPE